MKIGLDLRFLKPWALYSDFVKELVLSLAKKTPDTKYNIYLNQPLNTSGLSNIIVQQVNIKIWSLKEQVSFYKILKKDSNNIVIFFDIHKPIFYKDEYYIIIPSLSNIYYQDFKKAHQKYKYLFFLNKTIDNAKKIICFDENTKDELSERLDIVECKTSILTPFFTWKEILERSNNLKLDIKPKNNIKNDYFIYNWWLWIEKNLDRLINVFERLNESTKKVDLVIIWSHISNNVELRDLVISKNLQNNVHFLWGLKNEEKRNYYISSLWVIFPSLYESFPFSLNEAIFFNTRIIASNLKNNKDILWNYAYYFSPISSSSIIENINKFFANKTKVNYSEVLNNINPENTVKQLIKIIK